MELGDVVKKVKRDRGVEGGKLARLQLDPRIEGDCGHNVSVAEGMEGKGWFSPIALVDERQRYPGHMVGVVPLASGNLAVVDYSKKDPMIGVINKGEDIAGELERITGYGGWGEWDG